MKPISINIDVTKIPKDCIVTGAKPCKDGHTAKYLSLFLGENRDGVDQFGNDGYVKVSLTKQQREAGREAPFIGNWRFVGQDKPAGKPVAKVTPKWTGEAPTTPAEEDDVPF